MHCVGGGFGPASGDRLHACLHCAQGELLSMSMAKDQEQASQAGFRRQVTFRIGPEDAPLLELAAHVHGGLQAGILAALRLHASSRLGETKPPDASAGSEEAGATAYKAEALAPAGSPSPLLRVDEEDDLVELNVSEAASILGVSAAS
jgi:hypothetical protein